MYNKLVRGIPSLAVLVQCLSYGVQHVVYVKNSNVLRTVIIFAKFFQDSCLTSGLNTRYGCDYHCT